MIPTIAHSGNGSRGYFPPTRWSLVMELRGGGTRGIEALDLICRSYWVPIFAYIRARGHTVEDAEDLTQGFFEKLVRANLLGETSPAKGRLRTFLVVTLQNYLLNARARDRTQRRGGNWLRLQGEAAQFEIENLPSVGMAPDQVFDRSWALALLSKVLSRLEREYRAAGRGDVFDLLRPNLTPGGGMGTGSELSEKLGISEGALRVALFRFRGRYRTLLAEEVGKTLDQGQTVEEELSALIHAIAGR